MSTGYYRDRLGLESETMQQSSMTSRRTVTSSSASAYTSSRQEMRSSSEYQQSSNSRGHYAVSSHVSNGNLVVDNGQGVIQQGTHGIYEENLSKFKGQL